MSVILTDPTERGRFLRFAAVGAIGTVVDFSLMNLLVGLAKFSLVLAGSISFVAAVINNFIWNRFWTYPESRSKALLGQLIQFGAVNAFGLLIRIPILKLGEPALDAALLKTPLPFTQAAHSFLSHNITLAIAIAIVMLWNFFVNRYWTYNDI
ncbi:MAG: hypothetical protein OHK0031_03630 [Anaerolineales bacterium]